MCPGGVLHWVRQVRIRHVCTRQYLAVDSELGVFLTRDEHDPRTVFKLHPHESVCFELHLFPKYSHCLYVSFFTIFRTSLSLVCIKFRNISHYSTYQIQLYFTLFVPESAHFIVLCVMLLPKGVGRLT